MPMVVNISMGVGFVECIKTVQKISLFNGAEEVRQSFNQIQPFIIGVLGEDRTKNEKMLILSLLWLGCQTLLHLFKLFTELAALILQNLNLSAVFLNE